MSAFQDHRSRPSFSQFSEQLAENASSIRASPDWVEVAHLLRDHETKEVCKGSSSEVNRLFHGDPTGEATDHGPKSEGQDTEPGFGASSPMTTSWSCCPHSGENPTQYSEKLLCETEKSSGPRRSKDADTGNERKGGDPQERSVRPNEQQSSEALRCSEQPRSRPGSTNEREAGATTSVSSPACETQPPSRLWFEEAIRQVEAKKRAAELAGFIQEVGREVGEFQRAGGLMERETEEWVPTGDDRDHDSFRRWFFSRVLATRTKRGRAIDTDVFLLGFDGTTRVIRLGPAVRGSILYHRVSEITGIPLGTFYLIVDGRPIPTVGRCVVQLREASVIRMNLRVVGGKKGGKVPPSVVLRRAANRMIEAQTGVNLLKAAKETGLAKAYRTATRRDPVPVVRGLKKRLMAPRVSTTSKGTVVEGCELVGTVYGQISYDSSGAIVNSAGTDIGNFLQVQVNNTYLSTFLASFEDRFEEVEWVDASLEVDATCPTTTQGGYYLAYQPDPDQSRPTNENEIASMGGRFYSAFEDGMIHLDKAKLSGVAGGRKLYVTNSINGSDSRLVEAGEFYVASVGASANDTTFGKCYFHYKLVLSGPLLQRATPGFTVVTVINKSTDSQSLTSGTAASIYGYTTTIPQLDGLKLFAGVNVGSGQIFLPRGSYTVRWSVGVTRDNAGAMSLLAYFWDNSTPSGGSTTQQVNISTLDVTASTSGFTYVVKGDQDLRIGQDGAYYYLWVKATFTGGTAVVPASTADAYNYVVIRGA